MDLAVAPSARLYSSHLLVDLGSAETRACPFLVAFTVAHFLVAPTGPYVFFPYLLTLPPVDRPKSTLYEEVRR